MTGLADDTPVILFDPVADVARQGATLTWGDFKIGNDLVLSHEQLLEVEATLLRGQHFRREVWGLRLAIAPTYLVATDKFMSGWGQAKAGKSYVAALCPTEAHLAAAQRKFATRPEFRRIRTATSPPKAGPNDHVAVVNPVDNPVWFPPT